jgi:hypothetical protein
MAPAAEQCVSLRGAVQENLLFWVFFVAPSGCDRVWLSETASKVTELGLLVRCG